MATAGVVDVGVAAGLGAVEAFGGLLVACYAVVEGPVCLGRHCCVEGVISG